MTEMRSATVIASSWSWVTMTKVRPSVSCRLDQLELRLLAQLLVERAERLVEQQHLRPLGDGAGERHALPLAAGELVGLALGELLHLDELQHLGDARLDLGLRHLVLLQAEGDVLLDLMCGKSA